MKQIHNIFLSGRPRAVKAAGQPFPNSGGVVVAFSNCQLSIVNCTSSTFHSKFSVLYSKFSFSQGFLYAPFGEITTEFNATFGNDVLPKYSFNAKELDEETGMYYYEARYYKPPVFTSRDPMFEKYFWMTPYAYCANNPVKYVDPDGKKVVINGDEQEAAFDEFKKGAARYGIKVKMNKHGVIRGRRYFGKSLSPEGEQILHAIRDKRINVNINATSSNTTEGDKPFFGGAFLGNTLSLVKNNKDGVAKYRVNTKQDVNPSDLKALSDYYGMPGQDMLHEVTESYEGGLLALERKESINNSLADISSFQIVHQRAIPQSGGFNQENKYHPDNKELQIGFIWSIGLYSKVWVLPQYKSLITNP